MINKKLVVITAILTLLPILLGLYFWNDLPDTIATHFNAQNVADGFSSKGFTVFGIPALLCAVHILGFIVTNADPKKQNIGKQINLVYWIVPVISITMMSFVIATALGNELNIGMIVNLILGVLFIAIGNYLPKVRQNYSFGIKIPWTLNSEENWNRTHRLGGWLFVGLGILFLVNSIFVSLPLCVVGLAVVLFVPIIYSYSLHKKGI